MENDNIRFNEKLKFSWGHIIAAIALIFIAYCSFVGAVYLLKGRFAVAGVITAVVTLLIGLLFFIPQQLKATERRFGKRIKWERAFVFASPILFILLMVPFAHAWTVHHRQQRILDSFGHVIHSATNMFQEYETYSQIRILDYRHTLEHGNSNKPADITTANKTKVLSLVLLSSNYDNLKLTAEDWMSKAVNRKINTWNIFLLGNITEIQEAIHDWHGDLQNFSETVLSDEKEVKVFDSTDQCIDAIDENINMLTSLYTDIKGFSPMTLLWLLLCYMLLLFPYLLQSRHSKTVGSNYTLFGFRNKEMAEQKKTQREEADVGGTDTRSQSTSSDGSTSGKFESFKI